MRGNSIVCRATGPTSKKRLIIKKLADVPQLPSDFQEETWKKLSKAITAVHNLLPVSESKESLYNSVKDLCTHKLAPKTFQRLQEQCKNHLKQVSMTLNRECKELDALSFLDTLEQTWKDHCTQIRIIRDIFLYLDRTYVIHDTDVKSIWDMGLLLFRDEVIVHDPIILQKTVDGILSQIECERNGETIQRSLIQTLTRMLSSLEIYATSFEGSFLEQTRSFYHQEGLKRIDSDPVPIYIKFVEKRIQEEQERISFYLEFSTSDALLRIVHNQLVLRHAESILEKGFEDMMKANALQDLHLLYSLFSFIKKLEQLKNYFNSYIKTTGLDIVMRVDRDATMVEDLLGFKKIISQILEVSFEINEDFAHSMKEGFEYFINKRQNKPAELMARFIDEKLRRGQKKHTETEIECLLDDVISLFRSIEGKDVFQGHYRNLLSTRLLMKKSSSLDLEKYLITKLKQECGSTFTVKLEGMFKDINISNDIMVDFKSRHPDVDMTVNVLSRGIWPEWPVVDVTLPQYFLEDQATFENFYRAKYSGRKLTWHSSKAHCVLSANYSNGPKTFYTSLLQSIILLLFNTANRLSLKDIRERTGIVDSEVLELTLQTLAYNKKMRILIKGTKGPLTDETVFGFNEAFTHKLLRLKVNQVQEKETEQERENTNTSVFLERQYQIDAAIVRVMKTRKKLKHSILLAELYNQLSFPVKPVDIKKRIESLIEREYLERDDEDAQTYSYLA